MNKRQQVRALARQMKAELDAMPAAEPAPVPVITSTTFQHTRKIHTLKDDATCIRQAAPSAAKLNMTGRQFRKACKAIRRYGKYQEQLKAANAPAV